MEKRKKKKNSYLTSLSAILIGEIKYGTSHSLNSNIFRDFNSEYIDVFMAYND